MFRKILLFVAALLVLPVSAAAQDQEGTWALKINDAHIWVFTMERDGEGGWDGSWLRPARFEGNGMVFIRFAGAELVETVDGMERDGVVQLRFRPTQQGGTGDVLHFTMTGENEMTMEYLGTELEPYPLVRVVRGSGLGPFDEGMIYDRDNALTVSDYDPANEPSEAELAAQEAADEALDAAEADGEAPDAASTADIDAAAQAAVDEMNANALEEADEAPAPRINADFLDLPARGADDAVSLEPADDEALARACTDLDRSNLPSPDALLALWGDDYEQLGDGLDIREYAMSDGSVARITVLDDRIFLNRCGPA